MNHLYRYLCLMTAFLIGFSGIVRAQRDTEKWRDYLSYNQAKKICVTPGKVFVVTTGGLAYFDIAGNSVHKYSDIRQLSDFGIKTIGYSQEAGVLVVAYENGNIDLVYENRVINLSDIKRKQITGKSINNISFFGNEAYLSCSFGIVVLNLEKREVKDTYIIGDGGTYLNVNDTESDAFYLYAATNNGIYRAERDGANLLDYSNWRRVENIPRSHNKFNHLVTHGGKIIANYTPERWDEDEMYILDDEQWQHYQPQIRYAFDIQSDGTYLVSVTRDWIYIINALHQVERRITRYDLPGQLEFPMNPKSAAVSPDGTLWIADDGLSLIRVIGENFERVALPGPADNKVFSLYTYGSDLLVSPGILEGWEYPRFRRLRNNRWKNFDREEFPELDGFFNIIATAVDPLDPDRFFAASWGGGLLEFKNDAFVQRFTDKNSLLASAFPEEPDEPYIRIGGFDFDSKGNLWMTNSEVAKNLVKYNRDGTWESFSLPDVASRYKIGSLVVTQNDDKWIVVPNGNDAYVVDKDGKNERRLLVTSYFSNGEQVLTNRMNEIYSIAKDRKGAIWIGTSKGVAVYNNPNRIWTTNPFYAIQPSLDLGDGYYHPLLETETVTAIAVDGANRKWLGTANSGVYLVSEDGTKEIHHFTEENSPLISNQIMALAINQQSGELFIGTNQGLVSYQGDAIGPEKAFSNVYVFPNPVRENWAGPVTITGLVADTDVKITDITGNLVFQGTSLGGQAVWDGKNLNGTRVRTGVYLVFCSDKYGEETIIEKLLFVN